MQALLGHLDAVVGVDVSFQSITHVGAEESEGVCLGNRLVKDVIWGL